MRLLGRSLLVSLIAVALAAPLAAYTIYLKSGATIDAKEKYKLSNGRALITLVNGTHTFIDAKQIDVPKTDANNTMELGDNGKVIDQGTSTAPPAPAPPPQEQLSNFIESRGSTPHNLPQARRAATNQTPNQPTMSRAGYLDLTTLPRTAYGNLEVASDLQEFFHLQGLQELTISAGASKDHALVEVMTNSEGSVFQALTTAANALLHLRDRFPGKVSGLELVMTTPTREHAGQFVLTPEMAADLVAKRIEATAFFVQHVQF
jgi:hypothetical protein